MMMDHLELSSGKFEDMCAFYDAVLEPLRITRIVSGSLARYGRGNVSPLWVRSGDRVTFNAHYAFSCVSRALAHDDYEAAKAIGGTGLREPKLHPHIDLNYYAGYACDPDGHLVEFVCRQAET